MNLKAATEIANKYLLEFKPFCERIEIAGSIRRKKSEVNDIEIVCIPKFVPSEELLPFEVTEVRDYKFIRLVNSFPRVRGNGNGKYARLILPEPIQLDLFITTPGQWGLIYMIRTGSADFAQRMVTEIKPKGYFSKEGFLWCEDYGEGNQIVPLLEEKDFFTVTGMPWVEPENREK